MQKTTAKTALRNFGFIGGLVALATGLWWERPSLALIVPGAIVLGVLVYGSTRKGNVRQ